LIGVNLGASLPTTEGVVARPGAVVTSLSPTDPRPTATDRVRLRVGGYVTVAPVITADQASVHLALAEPTSGAGEIVFSHPRGVISLTGTVEPGGDGAVFTVVETRKLEQRRGAFRLAVACPVHVVRAHDARLDYRTADLSLTGVRLLDAYELTDGEHIRLEIQLGDQGVVEVEGDIVRRDELSVGVAFTDISAATDLRIGAFISAAQRRRVRATV
jgi:hypothetical protein